MGDVQCEVFNRDTGETKTVTVNLEKIVSRCNLAVQLLFKNGKYAALADFFNEVEFTFQVATACTDGIRIFFNPLFVNELIMQGGPHAMAMMHEYKAKGKKMTQAEFDLIAFRPFFFVLIHEIYHQVYRHIEQSKFKEETRNGQNHQLANVSMDAEINRDIEIQFPEFAGITEETGGIYMAERFPVEVWQQIFDELYKNNEFPDEEQEYTPDGGTTDDSQSGQSQGQNGSNQQQQQQGQGGQSGQQGQQQQQQGGQSGQGQDGQQQQQGQNGQGQGQGQDGQGQDGQQGQNGQGGGQSGQGNQKTQQQGNGQGQGGNGQDGDDNQNGQSGNGGQSGNNNGGGTICGGMGVPIDGNNQKQGQNGQTVGGQPGQQSQGNNQNGGASGNGPFDPNGNTQSQPSNKNSNPQGAVNTNDNGNNSGNKTQPGGQKIKVTVGSKWGNNDMIDKKTGEKIGEHEGNPYTGEENKTPEEVAKQRVEESEGKLKGIGKGTACPMDRKLDAIKNVLGKSVVDWRHMLAKHLKQAGGVDIEDRMARKRLTTDRMDKYELVHRKEYEANHAADVFYLVDASGSIGSAELYRVFSEVMDIETKKNMTIRKSAFTYFADNIDKSRIRVWDPKTPKSKKMSLIEYKSGLDVGGGTEIAGSIIQVTKSGKKYYSTTNPHTLMIVFTDGEDYFDDMQRKLQTLPNIVRKKLVFVIMNYSEDRMEQITNCLVSAGVKKTNIVCIDMSQYKK